MTTSPIVDTSWRRQLLASNPVFGVLDAETQEEIAAAMQFRVVPRGEILVRVGDPGDGVYLVVSGRLRIDIAHDDGRETTVNELGRGELIGEVALLTYQPRMATVVATRDSHLLFLSAEEFDRVVRPNHEAMRAVSGVVVERLKTSMRHGPTTSPATAIVLVPLDHDDAVCGLGGRLAAALEPLAGRVPVLGANDVDAAVGADASSVAREMWCDQMETAHPVVIYQAGSRLDGWTDACVRRADLLVMAAMADGSTEPRPIEEDIRVAQGLLPTHTELVLMHRAGTSFPRGTAHWLRRRNVQRHHHVRVDRPADLARVARLISGNAIGVVFSGGGARGIAHVGVLRTLVERGVPIDATAGASIGAIVAGAVAREDDPNAIAGLLRAALLEKSPLDLTLPAVSIASGGRVTHHIRTGASGLDLEDTWKSFRCVSTNLTRGSLEVHERGAGWAAVRASFSIPGLFPPMRNEAGDVLVDGGILDNLPVSTLRAAHPGITVIAVDVGAKREPMKLATDSSGVVSGWRYAVDGLRRRDAASFTSLPRVLLRLTELGSQADADPGDCCIKPEMGDVSLLDFDRFDELVEIGARGAAAALDHWLGGSDAPASTIADLMGST